MNKKYDVFISFAEPDRGIAMELNALFTAAKLSCYFAPENLPKETPQEWQKGILDQGLVQSRCFVPIFSRQSLVRRWVLFEAGAAAALRLNFFITHVDGISEQDIGQFPYTHHLYHFKLFSEDDLRNLIINILKEKHGNKKTDEVQQRDVDFLFANRRQLVQSVICHARRRWVFIAGNCPNKFSKNSLPKSQIPTFVRKLAIKLINSGFNLSACPQVKSVGKVVLQIAQKRISEQPICSITGCPMDYEIAGIYPIDRDVRFAALGDSRIRTRWMEHLLEFRKSYLLNKDWLILIGGNEGTLEEFMAAQQLNTENAQGLQTCFVPCFGGSAMKLNRKRKNLQHPELCYNGCKRWRKSSGLDSLVENIIKILQTN